MYLTVIVDEWPRRCELSFAELTLLYATDPMKGETNIEKRWTNERKAGLRVEGSDRGEEIVTLRRARKVGVTLKSVMDRGLPLQTSFPTETHHHWLAQGWVRGSEIRGGFPTT